MCDGMQKVHGKAEWGTSHQSHRTCLLLQRVAKHTRKHTWHIRHNPECFFLTAEQARITPCRWFTLCCLCARALCPQLPVSCLAAAPQILPPLIRLNARALFPVFYFCLRTAMGAHGSNRLLLSFTHVSSDRKRLSKPTSFSSSPNTQPPTPALMCVRTRESSTHPGGPTQWQL